jgi:small GTP-binding protein
MGHTGHVNFVAITPDGTTAVSGSADNTLKVWDLAAGRCRATFEGHTGSVMSVAITPDGTTAVSASRDSTLKVWGLATGHCKATFMGHTGHVNSVAITPDGTTAVSGSADNTLGIWRLPVVGATPKSEDDARYTNAKVVLVGESGVGKTGLGVKLAEDNWVVSESTHGMNVWPFHLGGQKVEWVEREVWLWDFAGQPDYRLIHQLFMDQTALALVVFDPQNDNPFAKLPHWENAISEAVGNSPPKLLVAARCDRGGLTVSTDRRNEYQAERNYAAYLETSAKSGAGCLELKAAIAEHIPWDDLGFTASSRHFKTLKNEIMRIKAHGMELMRVAELLQRLRMNLPDEQVEEDQARTVIGLLAGQGLVYELPFGDFVLLQSERINDYASAVVQRAREDKNEMGTVCETDVLNAVIPFPAGMTRMHPQDEEVVLLALVQLLVTRSLCIRERGQLVFPSHFRIDRPPLEGTPRVSVTYRFCGSLDTVYATLIVRLHFTDDFEIANLWHYAADFKTIDKRQAGLIMNKLGDAEAEVQVYFGENVPDNTQVSFIRYIHQHLNEMGEDVVRERAYFCPECDEAFQKKTIRKRIELNHKDIRCPVCEMKVPLFDLLERQFENSDVLQAAQKMDSQAGIRIDNESLELILEGQARTIAREAGQIFRLTADSDGGIDGDIEFKDAKGDAKGQCLHLQLKSSNSYKYKGLQNGKEVFTINNDNLREYWLQKAYPVMLVIRQSDGNIRWMDVSAYLKGQKKPTRQVIFEGEPFTAQSVAMMRDQVLGVG